MKYIIHIVALFFLTGNCMAEITDEEIAALYAKPSVFEKIAKDPSLWIGESEHAFAIRDKYPQAPVHLLVIPKKRVPTILQASPELIGEMFTLANKIAIQEGLGKNGFRGVLQPHYIDGCSESGSGRTARHASQGMASPCQEA